MTYFWTAVPVDELRAFVEAHTTWFTETEPLLEDAPNALEDDDEPEDDETVTAEDPAAETPAGVEP